MTKVELIIMHRTLAHWHEKRSKQVALDILHEHHADMARRLLREATNLEESAFITDETVRENP